MPIDRVTALTRNRFISEYMQANSPVVIADALRDWPIEERWTPEYLARHFADEKVQVYNSYFDLKSVRKLGSYLKDRFNRSETAANAPYVRWYTKLRNVDFYWADAAFAKMRANWSLPYFLPDTDYVLPFSPAGRRVDPTADYFPARGLFISERGAKTGLHVDPWGSDAVLCQLYGRKTWVMYGPEQGPYLRSEAGVVDLDHPDPGKFPDFDQARATCEFVLEPGDTLYVPHGWYHTARSDTDSISLTWNFVHRTGVDAFVAWLGTPRSKIDDDIIRFFFSSALNAEVTNEALERLVAVHFLTDDDPAARRLRARVAAEAKRRTA